jgi:hypothetical protein
MKQLPQTALGTCHISHSLPHIITVFRHLDPQFSVRVMPVTPLAASSGILVKDKP